jgi:hypothetical protein
LVPIAVVFHRDGSHHFCSIRDAFSRLRNKKRFIVRISQVDGRGSAATEVSDHNGFTAYAVFGRQKSHAGQSDIHDIAEESVVRGGVEEQNRGMRLVGNALYLCLDEGAGFGRLDAAYEAALIPDLDALFIRKSARHFHRVVITIRFDDRAGLGTLDSLISGFSA